MNAPSRAIKSACRGATSLNAATTVPQLRTVRAGPALRLECRTAYTNSFFGALTMTHYLARFRTILGAVIATAVCFGVSAANSPAQQRDPAEPQQAHPHPKLLPRPAGGVARQSVDEKSMRALIEQLV